MWRRLKASRLVRDTERVLRADPCPRCGAWTCPNCGYRILQQIDHSPTCVRFWQTHHA
jgi:DNA-directed RNA polymerase subunit RPC12/RpoP